MKTYSNPRLHAIFPDWPFGRKRATAQFEIETHPTRGQRAVRTIALGQQLFKPKKLTYAIKSRIVDGDDGRTYIAEWNGNFFSIMRGDMKIEEEAIFSTMMQEQDGKFVKIENPRFAELQKLFI